MRCNENLISTQNMLSSRKASGSEHRAHIINTFTANRFVIFPFIDGYSRLTVQVRKLRVVSELVRKAVRKSLLLFKDRCALF
jgi:hypothetical protein